MDYLAGNVQLVIAIFELYFHKRKPRIDPTYEVKALGRRPDKYGGEMRGFFYHLV